MVTERRYMIMVAITMIIEIILLVVVNNSDGLRNLYYTEGFAWFSIVFGVSSFTHCVFPAILFFEKKPDKLHGLYLFSILATNILFLFLIFFAYNSY